MSSTCPFCRSQVNAGATVCASCGAFVSSPLRQGGGVVGLFLLFLWGNYLLFGPGMIAMAISERSAPAGVIGLAITTVGFFLLKKLMKFAARPLWYRRN